MSLFIMYCNVGLTISLIFGGMILVRPIANRVLRPRQRAVLWYLGWYFFIGFNLLGVLGYLPLHMTFRSFLSARTGIEGYHSPLPAMIPVYDGPGRYNLSLPGNIIVPVSLTGGLIRSAVIVWAAGIAAMLVWSRNRKNGLRTLEQSGEEVSLAQLGVEDPELKTPYFEKITPRIFLCGGLPTSYVREDLWGNGFFIYLQRELPPHRLALVLRHELKHIQFYHVRYKYIAHMALILFWWSPLVWLAFRVMCRDMELACDEAVMDGLDEDGRREYARTIAELGAGRPLWESAATFGECDAGIRVRRAVNWRRARPWEKALSWTALVLLFIFFYCGSPAGDGTLAADQKLAWSRALAQEVTELPMYISLGNAYYPVSVNHVGQSLSLTEIWTDPDAAYVYGLDTQGEWWRFNLDYISGRRKYYALNPLHSSEAPELNGLERVK